MTEFVAPTFELPPHLNFDQLQILTSGTADYQEAEDPEIVLRNGLVEEVYEYLKPKIDGEPLSKEDFAGEIGDILWYCSEIARHRGLRLSDVIGITGISLDDYQVAVAADPQISKVVDNLGREIDFQDRPHDSLAILAMRVADVMNPQNDELWNGYEQRLELPQALNDLIVCISNIASAHDIKLSEAISITLGKLDSRPRQPHVIEKEANDKLKESVRYRLLIDPWVRSLFFKKTAQ